MNRALEHKYATEILDCFEDLLDQKGIDIPSEDRNGEDGEARIYGTEYFELEDMIVELLKEFKEEVHKSCENN